MKTTLKARLLSHILDKKKDEGFTLIELLVVIIIIGILSAIALPSFLNQASRARETEGQTNLGAINRGQQAYLLEFGSLAADTDKRDIDDDGTDEEGLCVLDVGVGDCTANAVQSDFYGYSLDALGTTAGGDKMSQALADPTLGSEDDKVIAAMKGCTSVDGDTEIARAKRGDGQTHSAVADATCTL